MTAADNVFLFLFLAVVVAAFGNIFSRFQALQAKRAERLARLDDWLKLQEARLPAQIEQMQRAKAMGIPLAPIRRGMAEKDAKEWNEAWRG